MTTTIINNNINNNNNDDNNYCQNITRGSYDADSANKNERVSGYFYVK